MPKYVPLKQNRLYYICIHKTVVVPYISSFLQDALPHASFLSVSLKQGAPLCLALFALKEAVAVLPGQFLKAFRGATEVPYLW